MIARYSRLNNPANMTHVAKAVRELIKLRDQDVLEKKQILEILKGAGFRNTRVIYFSYAVVAGRNRMFEFNDDGDIVWRQVHLDAIKAALDKE